MKKKCLNCGKKLENRHYAAKFCNEDCSKEYKKLKRNVNVIAQLKKRCSYNNCKEIAKCVINSKFVCREHFKRIKKEMRLGNIMLNCLNCGNTFEKSQYAKCKRFCCITCRITYRKKQEVKND